MPPPLPSELKFRGDMRPSFTTAAANRADYERAWYELRVWLEKNAPRLESHPDTRQEIVQETLIALQRSLSHSPLQRPHSLLTYAYQTMSRQHIDWNRRQTAEKRDWRNTIPLEELDSSHDKDKINQNWEEFFSVSRSNWRTIERTVSNQEVRQQLLQFAQLHLPTDLQQQVFEAHFLDGLSPVEIAQLAGKQPHEIRLIKARIVKKLQTLPPETTEQLLDILGRINDDG
jgi:RNA polymerase sigma factor (sigma-70 family)